MVFPLGLAALAASLGREHEVRGLDLNLDPFPWPNLVRALDDFKPAVVGISFRNIDPLAGNLISFVPHLKTLGALLKLYAPEAAVVLGGSAFTLFSRRLMEEVPEVDIALSGEAETVFPLVLRNIDDPGAIPGALWRKDGVIRANEPEILHCPDLDSLPLPDWGLFNPTGYGDRNRYVAFMGVETKRGCPNGCSYCLYPVLQGRRLRLRTPERVVDELEILQHDFGIRTVHFTDAVVNQPRDHLKAICRQILKRRLEIGWTGFFREDALSEDELDLYGRAGLATIYFSADGTTDHALGLLEKNLTMKQVLHAASLAARSGILTVYHFIVNLPGETRDSIEQARALMEKLFFVHSSRGNLGAVVINNLRLYPGAPLTAKILRDHLIDPAVDLLYPTYFNPPPRDALRHELSAFCMNMGAVNYLKSVGDNQEHRGKDPFLQRADPRSEEEGESRSATD
jgi:putative variant cofactor biosynthesis B12-binding/radical SAM domain protein 1